jgi:hypothetical protein
MIAPRAELSMAIHCNDVAERTKNGPASIPSNAVVGLRGRDRQRVGREFSQGASSPTIGAPERALWAAILSDAVAICLGRTSASLGEGGAALSWIQEGSTVFGGFGWCCDLLGLDDSAIRERVRRGMSRLHPTRRRWLAASSVGHVAMMPVSCGPTATAIGHAVSKQQRHIDPAAPKPDTGAATARPIPRARASMLPNPEPLRARTANRMKSNRRSS